MDGYFYEGEKSSPERKKKRTEKKCDKCLKNATLKHAGPYVLGPLVKASSPKCVMQCLGRRTATNNFYHLKLLTFPILLNHNDDDTVQGKILIHTEFTILSLINDMQGVPKVYNFFEEKIVPEINLTEQNYCNQIQNMNGHQRRICLVLDCLFFHDYDPHSVQYVNLQQYVIKSGRLSEKHALVIFADVVSIVINLHKRNIIHRDLKLGNIILNTRVTLTNFGFARHLNRDNELLKERCGTPAYVSPEIVKGSSYCGKAADVWSLGVILYTMLYGRFPFFDLDPRVLYEKIKTGHYEIPVDEGVSDETMLLIQGMLMLNPKKRVKTPALLKDVQAVYHNWYASESHIDVQVVPAEASIIEVNNNNTNSSCKDVLSTDNFPDAFRNHQADVCSNSRSPPQQREQVSSESSLHDLQMEEYNRQPSQS